MSMKHIRKQAEAAQSSKLHKLGATGSLKMARKGQSEAIANAKKYATGGYVGGGDVGGAPAKPSTAKPGRKKAGAGKKGKGDTNIVIALGGKPGGPGPDAGGPPLPPDAGGGPPMPLPPGGPGGGPPLPMRARGGRIPPKEEGGKGVELSKDKELAKPFKKGGKC